MIITNMQRMSMDDGPGIRTTVFVKGCPLRCKWCHNPECLESTASDSFLRNFPESFEFDGCAEALCESLARDRSFFEATGGGVTISGGEPLLYPDFAESIGRALKAPGIPLAVDTCGFVPWSSFEQILPWIDLFLYDLKTSDSTLHERLTGRKNELIWENLSRLTACRKEIRVRIPVIGGANDAETEKIAKRLPVHKSITCAELLPYHSYGVGKYKKMNKDYPGAGFVPPDGAYMSRAAGLLREKGIRCFLQGKEVYD